jgi:hypothetical protein
MDSDSPNTKNDMKHLMETNLPHSHLIALSRLVHFFEHVTRYSDSNKMGPEGVSIVFGMNILKPKVDDPLLLSQHARFINKVTEILVRNADFFFPIEVEMEEEKTPKREENTSTVFAPPPKSQSSSPKHQSFLDNASPTTPIQSPEINTMKSTQTLETITSPKPQQTLESSTLVLTPKSKPQITDNVPTLTVEKPQEKTMKSPRTSDSNVTSPRSKEIVKNIDPATMTYTKPIDSLYKKSTDRVLSKPRESLRLWQEIFDVKSQKYYYYNPLTGTTTWTHPSKMTFEEIQKEAELLDKLSSNTMFSGNYKFKRGESVKNVRDFKEQSQE